MSRKRAALISAVSTLFGFLLCYLLFNSNLEDFKSFSETWGNLVLSAILVLITAYYAWQTRQSVKIMEESSSPYVSLQLENEPSHINDIYLAIRNDGDQSAFDVTLEVLSGNIQATETSSRDTRLSDMLFIKSKLAVLSPRSERRHLIVMTTPAIWKNIESVRTVMKVLYCDKKGKVYSHEFDLDYASLPFSGEPRDSTYQQSERSLQSIDKSLQVIAKK